MTFLTEKAQALRSLLPGRSGAWTSGEEEARPYLGWFAAEWHGQTIEVVLTPQDCGGETLCVATDEAVLRDFVGAMMDHALRPSGRCLRYAEGWEDAPDLDAELGKVTWDDIVLPPDTLARLREAVEGFFDNREAFASFGFAWKRGVLLIGPPGTGQDHDLQGRRRVGACPTCRSCTSATCASTTSRRPWSRPFSGGPVGWRHASWRSRTWKAW